MAMATFLGACSLAPPPGGAEGPVEACAELQAGTVQSIDLEAWVPRPTEGRAPVGLAAGDFDGDGRTDVFVAHLGGSLLLPGKADGTLGAPADATADGGPLPGAPGVAAADLDGDGDLDLVLSSWPGDPALVLRNQGDAQFVQEVLSASPGFSSTPTLADFDGDGWLDVFLPGGAEPQSFDVESMIEDPTPGDPSQLWLGDGADGWTDISHTLPAEIHDAHSFHGAPVDADLDGDLDLYLANDFGPYMVPSLLLENDGRGGFSVDPDCACALENFGMGVGVGDANDDGWPDLYITDVAGPDLLLGLGGGEFALATQALGAEIGPEPERMTSWATRFVDMDGNGQDDLAVAFGRVDAVSHEQVPLISGGMEEAEDQIDTLLMRTPQGFVDQATAVGFDAPDRHRALITLDLDGDSRPELVAAGKRHLQLTRVAGGCGPGLAIEVHHANGHADVGATVQVQLGDQTHTRWLLPSSTGSSSEPVVFVGLGGRPAADVTVQWTDGHTQSWSAVPAGTRLQARP